MIIVRECKECGKKFEINEKEKDFYVGKKLELPKRCKECRAKRKEQKLKEEEAQKQNG